MTNDPKVIAHLLRSIARGTRAATEGQDIIFNAAADLLDPPLSQSGTPHVCIDTVHANRPFSDDVQQGVPLSWYCAVTDCVTPAACNAYGRCLKS